MAVDMAEATEAVVDLVEVADTEAAAVSEVDSALEAVLAAATANNPSITVLHECCQIS